MTAHLLVVARQDGPVYYAKWRDDGRQIKRRIGPAWIEPGDAGPAERRHTRHPGWIKRRGRPQDGFITEDQALARVPAVVAAWSQEQTVDAPRSVVTFDEAAQAWLEYEQTVKGVKATTLRDHRALLRRPDDVPAARGHQPPAARIMRAFGGRDLTSITTADITAWLTRLDRDPALSARTRNKYRAVVHSIFTYACRDDTFELPVNPVTKTDRRREPHQKEIVTYSPAEVAAIARALSSGRHRPARRIAVEADERAARRAEDEQDAALILVAAFSGLRMGELLALRWRHIGWDAQRIHVQRAYGAGEESSPKSGKQRTVPLADQPAQALARLSHRPRFTSPGDLVFCSRLGTHLDGSALRRRYKAARDVVRGDLPETPALRFHDLRHTFGTLAASRFDLTNVQAMMGHSDVTTTARYLHARPAAEDAAKLSAIFATGVDDTVPVPVHSSGDPGPAA